MKISNNTRIAAIRKGLMYLELQLDINKFPFSSDCFGTNRHGLEYSSKLPQFPFDDLHETFNLYMLVLLLEQHLSTNVRTKLIETMRPKEIGPINFFGDISGDCERLPNDADTTAVCYHALLKTNSITVAELASLSQSVYGNVNDDGVLQSYYVSKKNRRYNRLDAVCIINIVRFAYAQRQESLVKLSEDYVYNWLNSGNYKSGTLYYPSRYTFLYFCSQLANTNYKTRTRFMDTLRREFQQINQEDLKYPLDYALNILTGAKIGLCNECLIDKLLNMQIEDGSWPADALYATNRTKIYFGSKSISTIFSVLALIETI